MKRFRNPLSHYALFIGIYLFLALVLPANNDVTQRYGLTSLHYHLLLLAVVLPFIGIWFAAFYGFSRLRNYAQAIRDTPEGRDFMKLAAGSGWLAYALPISALISIMLNSLSNSHPNFHPSAIIINNYVSLILPLIAFTILCTGARRLSTRSGGRISLGAGRGLIIVFTLLGVFYCYFSFQHLSSLSLTTSDNIYYLPVWLAVVTIVMPYLYSWFVGLLAAYEIVLFATQSTGVLYARGLRLVGYGIATVIVSSIAVQYLSSVLPRTGALHLNFVLLGVFIIELLLAGGYGFIAMGARRLQRIEEV